MTKKPSRPVSTEGEKPLLPTAAPLLLTIKAAAAYLGITHYSLRNLVTTRQLPCVQLSRRILIDPPDLKELIAARKTFYTKKARRPPRKQAAKSVATPEPEPTLATPEAA